MRRAVPMALAVILFAAMPATAAVATTEQMVLATSKDEKTPAVANGILGWTVIDSRGAPHAIVRLNGHRAKRIGPPTAQTWLGGVDGTSVVLQLVNGASSEIRAYNATSGARMTLPAAVASTRWEYAPTISGGRVWFLRAGSSRTDGLLVTISTGRVHKVVSMLGTAGTLQAGQLSQGFIAYGACGHGRCTMKRYALATKTTLGVPRQSGRFDVAPGVASDGTVYFWRSRASCGASVHLMRWRPGAAPVAVLALPAGIDAGKTFVYRAGDGLARVYYERYHCTSSGRSTSDLYRIVDTTDPAHPAP
jgi:hypothetical protein